MKRIAWALVAAVALVTASRVAMGAYTSVTATALHSVTFCAESPTSTSHLTAAANVMQRRLDALGITHSAVAADGRRCLRVGIPGTVRRQVVSVLVSRGVVVIADGADKYLPPGRRVTLVCPPALPKCAPNAPVGSTSINARPPVLQAVVPPSEIQYGSASPSIDSTTDLPTVHYAFTSAGADRWCHFTSSNSGAYAAIVVDNRVVSDPSIEGAICSNQTQIVLGEGGTLDEAKRIAAYLNSGSYPAGIQFQLSGRSSH